MAVEAAGELGAALAGCLTVMSNPITTSVTRTASATISLQATRAPLSNSHTSPLPGNTTSTNFHAVLSKEDATNSSIGNESRVLIAKVPPSPTSPLPNLPNGSSFTARTAITDRSGQNEMPGTAKTHSEPVADAEELSGADRTPDGEGLTTVGAVQPPAYPAPEQTMPAQARIRLSLIPEPTSPPATAKDSTQDARASTRHAAKSAQVPQPALPTAALQVEPMQTNPQVLPMPPQPNGDDVEPEMLASVSDETLITTVSSGSGDVKPSSGRPGHARAGAHPDADAGSMVSDQDGRKPDPTTETQVPPNAPAPSMTLSPDPIATSSSHAMTSSHSAGSQGLNGARQINETPMGSGDGTSPDATPSMVGSPVTSSAPAPPSAASPLPSSSGISETTSSRSGTSSPQDLAQPVLRHSDDDITTHPPSRMTAVAASDAEPVMALTVAKTPVVDPAAPFAPAVMLPVKSIDSYMTNTSGHTATLQVAPAMISLATRTDGSNEITVSLNPRDLGQVEVRLIRGSDGTTSVSITASNPETLQELSQNVHHLHAALDAANIPVDGRNLSFNATPTAATGQGQGDPAGRDASTAHDGSTGGSGGQDPGQGRGWQQNRATRSDSDDNGAYIQPVPLAARKSWQLSGLNITA